MGQSHPEPIHCRLMQKYSASSILRHALSHHRKWPPLWRNPEPKPSYDVVIIGGGGHGLATAYFLASKYGPRNVAVLEKGWLGGGHSGPNTPPPRSNYFYPTRTPLYLSSPPFHEPPTHT